MRGTMPLYTTILDHATSKGPSAYEEVPLPNAPKISDKILETVPFEITNLVSKNERLLLGKRFIDIFGDLPPCVPPYVHTWFEFSYLGEPVAMNITTVHRDSRDESDFWQTIQDPTIKKVPVGGFIARAIVIRGTPNKAIAQMLVLCEAVFTSEGSIMQEDDGLALNRFMPHEWIKHLAKPYTEDEHQAECDFALTCFYDCLFACALMHCKNVRQVDEVLPRQLARARERRSQEKVIFKTLVVDPGKTPRKSEPVEGEKRQKRQHIVRGHFSEYGLNQLTGKPYRWPDGTPKGKLFGLLDGRYWVPEMVRGDDETGYVIKDYRIKGAVS